MGSAAALETLMNKLTYNIKNAVTFADDIFICTKGTFNHHLKDIKQLLESMETIKVKAKPSKISIKKEVIEVIGM